MGQDQGKPNLKELSNESKFTTGELSDWHNKFKKDIPGGKINKTQFIDLYQKMFGADASASNEFCELVFSRYDQDGVGVIDFNEFMTTLVVASRGTPDEKLIWAFKLYDLNGDGYLCMKEISKVLTSIYRSRGRLNPENEAEGMTKEILTKADDDQDSRLSEAEFIRHARTCPAIQEMFQL